MSFFKHSLTQLIASDSFGFDERSSSYLSLAHSVPQFAGAVTLYVLCV